MLNIKEIKEKIINKDRGYFLIDARALHSLTNVLYFPGWIKTKSKTRLTEDRDYVCEECESRLPHMSGIRTITQVNYYLSVYAAIELISRTLSMDNKDMILDCLLEIESKNSKKWSARVKAINDEILYNNRLKAKERMDIMNTKMNESMAKGGPK